MRPRLDRYDEKLNEAEYQLERLKDAFCGQDARAVGYGIRAFAAAARCVAEYVQTEAKTRGLTTEYYARHDADPVLDYFRRTRNIDQHVGPVQPREVYSSVTPHGFVPLPSPSDPPEQTPAPVVLGVGRVGEWRFEGWPAAAGTGEVVAACRSYLASLRQLLADAEAAGILERS